MVQEMTFDYYSLHLRYHLYLEQVPRNAPLRRESAAILAIENALRPYGARLREYLWVLLWRRLRPSMIEHVSVGRPQITIRNLRLIDTKLMSAPAIQFINELESVRTASALVSSYLRFKCPEATHSAKALCICYTGRRWVEYERMLKLLLTDGSSY